MHSVTASADTQQLAEGFVASLVEAAGSGIASIHCMEHPDAGQPDPCLAMLRRQGSRVPQTLRLYLQYADLADFAPILKTLARPRAGGGGAWAMDGSIASHSAALETDYLDRPGFRGSLHYSPEEAYALIAPFALSGFQTAVHALGTRGIESALGAYERVLHETGDEHNDLRLRIEHFSFPRPDQIQRAGALGLLTVVQPGRHWVDHHVLHNDEAILDSATRSLTIPLRSMIQAGCRIALSAEAPIQGLDPFIQIAGAVDHPDPAERLSLFEALRAATHGGAFAAFDDDSRGTFGRGMQADFVVLDGDPFLIPPEHIWALHVRETWIAGRKSDPEPLKKRSFISGILGSPAKRL